MPHVRDRLDDLQKLHFEDEFDKNDKKTKGKITKSVEEYLGKCEAIRLKINEIKDDTREANQIILQRQFFKLEDLQNGVNPFIRRSEDSCVQVHNRLREMVVNREDLNKEPTAETKMKYMQYITLREEFQSTINGHIECVKRYEVLLEEIKKRIQQSVQGEDYDETLQAPQETQAFIGNYLVEKHAAEMELRNIHERHNQLLEIETQLEEVRELFVRIAILVDQQQESINRAEHHAEISSRNVELANTELTKAEGTKNKVNKMKIYLIIGGIVIAIIILILILK